MAKDPSFDIVSEINMQEIDNAINQANKEISQRYDFKNSKTEIVLETPKIRVVAENDFRLNSALDILQSKLIRRQVPIKNLSYGQIEQAAGGLIRQYVDVKQGIEADLSKEIIKEIKAMKLKVQSQFNGDRVRVSGKNLDDLQLVIKNIKQKDYGIELQFINYR